MSRSSPTTDPLLALEDDLARLLPLTREEIGDRSPEGRCRLLAKLRRALIAERRRGLAGHWAYDLARHGRLSRAFRRLVRLSGLPAPAISPTTSRGQPATSDGKVGDHQADPEDATP